MHLGGLQFPEELDGPFHLFDRRIQQMESADDIQYFFLPADTPRLFDDVADAGVRTARNDHQTVSRPVSQGGIVQYPIWRSLAIDPQFAQTFLRFEIIPAFDLSQKGQAFSQLNRFPAELDVEERRQI